MIHACARDCDVRTLHHLPRPRHLMGLDERFERDAALIFDACANVYRAHLDKELRDFPQRRRSPRLYGVAQTALPCKQKQVPVVSVVVGVMMGNENRSEVGKRNASPDQLRRHAIAAIYNVCRVADNDDLRRRKTVRARAWSAAGPEQNEAAFRWRCCSRTAREYSTHECRCRALDEPSAGVHVHAT